MARKIHRIDLGKEFSQNPAGRTESDGPNSGEKFREKFLLPLLKSKDDSIIEIDLNDVYGLGSSFLEEAFGGLVRIHKFKKQDLLFRLKIISDIRLFEEKIIEYIKSAK